MPIGARERLPVHFTEARRQTVEVGYFHCLLDEAAVRITSEGLHRRALRRTHP